MKTGYIMIFVMCGSGREARAIAHELLKRRLIACANIVNGADSLFWWLGKIESARETMVVMKTTASSLAGVERLVRKMHSYDVPEIIAVRICGGSSGYLRWIRESVRP